MTDSLSADALRQTCAPSQFDFETTDELDAGAYVVGQERAIEAIEFGVGIEGRGYNIFALGAPGTGRRALVDRLLDEAASDAPAPSDWCYVNNFDDPRRPQALELPSGRGTDLRDDMNDFINELKTALPATFESEEYQTRRQVIEDETRQEHEEALEDLRERAREENIAVLQAPHGFVFAPIRDGEVVPPEEFQSLPEEERTRIQALIEEFQDELQEILRKVPERQRTIQERIRELNREMAGYAVDDLIDRLRESYTDLPEVQEFLDDVRANIVENVEAILNMSDENDGFGPGASVGGSGPWRRYRVNLVVDHGEDDRAPVITEDNPNYQNLVGAVEQIAQMGALVTDFNLIKPGALHRANGGYLVIEARKLLTQPYAWEGLKRALRNEAINIESPGQALGLMNTVTLDPEPIPLDVKVVLLGERVLYYLLCALDPDMEELFKVMADFDDEFDRTAEGQSRYATMLASIADREELYPLDRSAVARVIDRSARLVSDAEKLTTHTRDITDLLRESHYWADQEDADVISSEHVQQAIDAKTRRADRLREQIQESIDRETLYISTEGEQVGQINGLSVIQQNNFSFGRPNRITARVRLGTGEIIDIERETALGGPIHAKGVLILSGFLSGRYADDKPLSLSASLVFEQSYGGIDGDSASSAELYALLSAIAEVPLKQSLAVTGSVNQHGQVQPIGGVNEKIEGFFDVCKMRGLTGRQGVVIPQSNVKNLMLRRDVVDAIANDQFHVYPVETIDQGLELLTDLSAGVPDEKGQYPEGTFNARVEQRLRRLADQRQQFAMTDGQADQPSHE